MTNYLATPTFWEDYQTAQDELHDHLTYNLIAVTTAYSELSDAFSRNLIATWPRLWVPAR